MRPEAPGRSPGWPAAVRAVFLGGCVAACGCSACAAAFDAPDLGGPEIVKLNWNIRGLVVRDFNADGRNDIAVINNDRARIELLFQRAPGADGKAVGRRVVTNRWEPELEDARYDKRPLSTGVTVYCLAAGDLNSDGRVDLVYTAETDAVTVRLQSAAGDWSDKQVLDLGKPSQYLTTVAVTDYDGDGRDDLLVLLLKELVILRQTARGELAPPVRYALGEDNCWSLQVVDLNGDGRRDFTYLASSRRDGLRMRVQLSDGLLGPEVPHRLELSRTALELMPRAGGASPAFAHVQNQTSLLTVFAFVANARPTASLAALKPRIFSPRTGAKNAPSYALGDINGDGRLDVAVADADGAQLLVYFQGASGELAEARAFPSLAEARGLAAADWDGDGRAELFVATAKEQTLGVARYTDEGRLAYPQPLPLSGRPLTVDAGVLAAGQAPSIVVAVEESGKRRIDFLAWRDGAPVKTSSVDLAGMRTDPRGARLLDANQDGRLDLAVFVPFEPMRLLLQNAEGVFTDVSSSPGYRRGLVEQLEPSALTLADVDGDGQREMLVAGHGLARVLRVDEHGTLQVKDQFNAREANADIAAAFATDIDGDEQREVVLFDRRAEQLQVLRRNAQKVFEYADTVPVSRIELLAAVQEDLDGDGREDLFFFGKDRFWVVPTAAPDFAVEQLFTYETDLKDVRYADLAMGDLNGDGTEDFVLADTRRNLIEVLARDGLTVKSVLHFRIFEADPHVQNRGRESAEPREMMIADVTGDDKNDLVLVVHDRLLIYPRE